MRVITFFSLLLLAAPVLAADPPGGATPASGLAISQELRSVEARPKAESVALADLVAEALAHNPAIAAARHELAATRVRPAIERAMPDPMISFGWNGSGAPWPGAGLGTDPSANIGVMVSQALPWKATRELRGELAGRETDGANASLDVLRHRVAADVKALYYQLAWAQAVVDVLIEKRLLMETLVEVTESRYGVGAAPQPDVLKAQADVTMMAIRIERVQQEQAVAAARLSAVLGRSPGVGIGKVAPLTLPDPTAPLDALSSTRLDTAPAVEQSRVREAAAETALALARRDYKPELGVAAGYYNMGAMPDMYMFRVDVKVPLRRASRDAAVAERTSRIAEARAVTAQVAREVAGSVDADVQIARSAVRLARLYHDTALPQARLALDSALASYETGKIDFIAVTTSVAGLVEYEVGYYDELRNLREALTRLEAATGRSLEP